MRGRVEQYDAIRIVDDVVSLDPRETALDDEDALSPALTDSVMQNHSVGALWAAIGDVRLVVPQDVVFLNVSVG